MIDLNYINIYQSRKIIKDLFITNNPYYFLSWENCDASMSWRLYFHDSASPQMEALVELHNNIMFYLIIILFGIGWILLTVISNYAYNKSLSNQYLNHSTLIESICTISPTIILILIAYPSFELLYSMDEVTDPYITLLAPEFINANDEFVEFNADGEFMDSISFVISQEELKRLKEIMRQGGVRPLPNPTGSYPEPPEKEDLDQSIRQKLIGQMQMAHPDATVYSPLWPANLQLTFLEFNRLHDKLIAANEGYVLKLTYERDYLNNYWYTVLGYNPTPDSPLIRYFIGDQSSYGGCRYRAFVHATARRPITPNTRLIDVFSGTRLVNPVTS